MEEIEVETEERKEIINPNKPNNETLRSTAMAPRYGTVTK